LVQHPDIFMPDLLNHVVSVASENPVLSGLLSLAVLMFLLGFIAPWVSLRWKLAAFTREIRQLREARSDPKRLMVRDKRLVHLWSEYCETLHSPKGALDPRTGIHKDAPYRATVPAEAFFNAQSIYEGRIHTEFFKHLPGLLTGLGIIATFLGLINGLGNATPDGGGPLKTDELIESVKEAFHISAAAITLAMIVTFFEKLIVAGLHRAVEHLCQDIDALYAAGASEDYLSRLVHSSEESTAQAKILKDALVGDLGAILERLTERQIETAAQQHAQLRDQFVSAIDHGLREPFGEFAQSLGQFRSQQGEQLSQGLQDSMAAFADKLDQMLGGQVGQAKALQAQTSQALESAVTAFQAMVHQVGSAGENATATISTQLSNTLEDVSARQLQMNDTMRTVVDELRSVVTKTQADTTSNLQMLLQELGAHVGQVVQTLHTETKASSLAHQDSVSAMATHTRESITELTISVRAQTEAIEHTTLAMRAAVTDLGSSVNRNIALMGEGAGEIRNAADRFVSSGSAMAEVLDRSRALSSELSLAASTLSDSTQDVQSVISDYRAARETFASVVDGLRGTVETAKREVAMTTDIVARMEAAAQKLIHAQTQADAYLDSLNEVLVGAHGSFNKQMLTALGAANAEFHTHLSKSTSLLASAIDHLQDTLGDLPDPTKRAA
jgi:methyl-accepting chemotaxis protein